MPQKVMNRWITVVGAILIQLALGAIYAWSLFTKPLTAPDGGYGFTAGEAAWVFSVGLASFASFMVLAGRWQAKIGPRPVALVGGVVLGAGYVLAGFFGTTFWAQLFLIGFVGGAGIGLAYVVPIAVLVKWFPDMKGLITGLAVAGFGFGATIWVKAGGSWFGLVESFTMFGLPPVQATFALYGLIFLAMVVLGGLVMINPPEGFRPDGWEPPAPTESSTATGAVDFTTREMLRTPQFYMIWFTFVCSGLAGLMVIYCVKLFGIDALKFGPAKLAVEDASVVAGTAMALYAIMNGLGRILWGAISDRTGRKAALVAMCIFQAAAMFSFYFIGSAEIGLIVGACIIGFNFGGNFALFAAATADFFGNRNVGLNYGPVFLAYGVAGIAGPQIAGAFKDAAVGATDASAWLPPFVIAGVACVVGAALMLVVKPPRRASGGSSEERVDRVEGLEGPGGDRDRARRAVRLAGVDADQRPAVMPGDRLALVPNGRHGGPRAALDDGQTCVDESGLPGVEPSLLGAAPAGQPAPVAEHQDVRPGDLAAVRAGREIADGAEGLRIHVHLDIRRVVDLADAGRRALDVVDRAVALDDAVVRESGLRELPVDVGREDEAPVLHRVAPAPQEPEAGMRVRGPVQAQPVAVEAPGQPGFGREPARVRHVHEAQAPLREGRVGAPEAPVPAEVREARVHAHPGAGADQQRVRSGDGLGRELVSGLHSPSPRCPANMRTR
jgi:MFS family permease